MDTVVGGLLTSEIAPTESASPKIMSDRDSILALGFAGAFLSSSLS